MKLLCNPCQFWEEMQERITNPENKNKSSIFTFLSLYFLWEGVGEEKIEGRNERGRETQRDKEEREKERDEGREGRRAVEEGRDGEREGERERERGKEGQRRI